MNDQGNGRDDGIVWFLRASEERLGAVVVVALEGRISSATASALDRVLASQDAAGLRGVIVDLSGVDYVNGAGLEVFEAAAARLSGAGCQFALCGLRPVVRTAFELGGLIPRLAVDDSRELSVRRLG